MPHLTRLLLMFIVIVFFIPVRIDTGGSVGVAAARVSAIETGLDAAAADTGLKSDLNIMIATIISQVLAIVGVVFLVLIIYGGVRWMTSGGNEQNVSKAKTVITAASIGLTVVLTAYVITYWITQLLISSTTTLPPA